MIKNPVTVTCYGETEDFSSMSEAVKFFAESAESCNQESSECKRYKYIIEQLLNGSTKVSDEDYKDESVKKNESAPKKSESSEDDEVVHGEQSHIFLDDDPNFQVTFRGDDDKVYTFYVNASNAESALDGAYSNFSTWHNLSIKGEEIFEEDIPEDKRSEYTVVNTNYAPKVNVAIDPYNGEGIRVVRVPEWFLPALVNADTSGMSEEDEKELDAFEQDLINRGFDATGVTPVCGPDGEYWDENLGDVLCSTTVVKK